MLLSLVLHPLARCNRPYASRGLALALAAGLAGCGAAKNPEQLIVKGDKFEITLQEYEQLLRGLPPVTKEAVAPMRRAVLQELIDEKLLAEAATGAGMDRDPANSQAIAAAKRNILAQAYVHTLTGNVPKPSESAVERYYNSRPALFGSRRRFVVEEYVLRSDLPDVRSYVETLDHGDFATLATLVSTKIPGMQPATVTRFSDELPDDRGGMLEKLGAGSNIVYQSPGQIHLGRIQSATVEPVALDLARPRIEQSLAAERTSAITAAAVKTLRKSRNVEIVNANLKAASASNTQEAPKS
ncbi:EpsD family peptidyl-prolyl cis-trans isomerase [Sphingomonas sp. BAUL-RG-20F-R05-02]|uniref:EpsD family peptidyl-prolyl cis-trans isomerase n=1 Tax=Sphingomonas sp. BAUL-RG-20F-R05-02 TaxID=2914830 RepID=UPI001F5A325E|nr:EpsD family peptidyl-prolyl cis-trans isomerase [Sphingomonas sp. BAUL-RG-20F-R05-02]